MLDKILEELKENPLDDPFMADKCEKEDEEIIGDALDDEMDNSCDSVWDDSFERYVEEEAKKYIEEKYNEKERKIFYASFNRKETKDVKKMEKTNKAGSELKKIKLRISYLLKKKMDSEKKEKNNKKNTEEDIDDSMAYWKVKETEFKKFFMLGMKQKKNHSKYVINLNLYFYTRLLLFDICFLTLYNLPWLQILLPLTTEIIFLAFIFKARYTYDLFETRFFFYKLAFQSYAIVLWLFLALCFSFSTSMIISTSIGYLRVSVPYYPFDTWLSKYSQYYALILVFLALLMENIFLVYKIISSVKESFAQCLKKKRVKKKREERLLKKVKEVELQ